MNYDVFISYRREDGKEFARQIQLKLENYGYKVFLDLEELKDGKFDQRIIDAICGSKVFVALLTPRYMSRCGNAEDWVRKEIECAAEHNIHIVPININREFTDFPSDCPPMVRTHIGQHQYSEIFTGQQFTTTMNDLNEHRLKPYIGGGSARPSALGAVVRIKPDMDCRVMKFGEEVALLQGGTYNIVRLMKGKHPLDFVSLECPADHIEKVYVVEDNQSEDFFEVALCPLRDKRLQAIEDEKRRQREEAERREHERREAERREAERIEAELRAKAEAERKAKEEAERKAQLATERIRLIKSEKARIAQMVLDGKGRDGLYMVGDYYNRDGVRGVVISPKSVSPDRDYTYSCGEYMLISLTEEGNAQWASDKNFGTLFKK
ncbi:MAG: TIR domain-containing protein, partial [Tidjanibacter sp.]|nr:TIR domain-containing protein [Tidjanibacter sp.]